MLQEMLITFPVLKSDTTSSKTLSFLLQSLNWNNLDPTRRNSKSFVDFKNNILKFIRPSPSNVFDGSNYKGIRLITQLRVGISHLREHKFKHDFQDCLNLICSCGLDIELRHIFLSTFSFPLYMATYYLIKKKTHASLTQQLNIFYPLKDLRSLLSSKFPSLNPSRSFLKCFIIFTSYSYSLLCFFVFIYS